MKKFSLTFLIFLTFLLFFLPTVQSEERSVTVKPKRDLSVEAKKGLDPALLNAKYHAIIIGNNNYKYITKLKTAIADAKSVDEILKNQYGFQTKLLIDATRGDILDTLNDFRKIGKNDNLLIYYAGHGVFEKEVGKAYWLPVDAKSDSPSNWIIADDITSSIKRITSRHILIVSDSCYSGTLTRAVSGDLSKAGEREEFIKKMLERPSRTLMASGGNEPVADEGGSGHSVFADAFLRALKEADKGIFTAEELFHGRVKSSVAGKSDQVPEYNDIKNSGHDGGDFIFKLASIPLLPLNKGGMEGVVEPEINVKEAPKSDFSLEDLDKKAKQIEDNKAAWGNTLNKMQGAFNQVAEYQKRDIEKDLKIAAWSKFLNSFTEDNPYSSEDESMRQKARQEIEKWQKVAMATVVGDTRDTVTGMELIFVKGGCYQMGDTFGDGESDEKPMHEVCVDDFYMGKYEVTVGEFRGFVNATGYRTDAEKNTGGVNGCFAYDQDDKEKQWNWREWASWKRPNKYQENEDNHPVACISWNDAKAFIEWMGRKSGKNYRLPTEAEWEYAARGGTTGRNYWGNSKEEACRYANVADRTKLPGGSSWNDKHECDDGYAFASPVGRFQANAFGLYDMMGNVWEWCSDWYADDYYRKSPKNNPEGVNSGQSRVIRGGSWGGRPQVLRASGRNGDEPATRLITFGFRLVQDKN